MANVKITETDGRVIELSDLSVDEIKLIVARNGNGHSHSTTVPKYIHSKRQPDFSSMKEALSDHAKKFLLALRQHPGGISADKLCEQLGFNSPNQIGGVTGGGISKLAVRFNIQMSSLYTVEKKFEGGDRLVTYKPGPDIDRVL